MQVRKTSLTGATGRRLAFDGLFACQTYKAGEVVGTYSGRRMTLQQFKKTSPEERVYALHASRNLYIVPKLVLNAKPDKNVDRLAFMNEPNRTALRNVKFQGKKVVATRDIKLGEEFFVFYGKKYQRNYTIDV